MGSARDRSSLSIWVLALAAAALVLVGVVGVPAIMVGLLERALQPTFYGGQVSVHVQGAPWRLLAGSFSALDVEAVGAEVRLLPVDRFFLRLHDVRIPLGSLFRGSLTIRPVGGGDGQLTLTRNNVEEYLEYQKGVDRPAVRMEDDVITIEGDVQGREARPAAGSDFRAAGDRFPPHCRAARPGAHRLRAAGPERVRAALVTSLNPLITLEGLPCRCESVQSRSGAAA